MPQQMHKPARTVASGTLGSPALCGAQARCILRGSSAVGVASGASASCRRAIDIRHSAAICAWTTTATVLPIAGSHCRIDKVPPRAEQVSR
jgi:hypothetical protein